MIGSRGLGDRFAIPAGELLPHGLDHLPPARRHSPASASRPRRACAGADRRSIRRSSEEPSRWFPGKMLRKGIALRGPPGEAANVRRPGDGSLRRQFVFRCAGLKLLEFERQLLDQPRRALRSLAVDLALELGDPKLLLRDQRHVFRSLRSGYSQLRGDLKAFSARSAASAAFSAATSSGRASRAGSMEMKGIIFSAILRRLKMNVTPCFSRCRGSPVLSPRALRPPRAA